MGAIEKIHELNRFGSILGLERMDKLLKLLSNPEENLKIIHVAGTNGKGSTSRFIYEMLQADGYKVGLYTSPFLEVFNERIEFDHQYISDHDLEKYTNLVFEKVNEMVEAGNDSPTEFEVVTAIAFLYFKEKKADYVVLEVGLGGRGDSTNVVKQPLATLITSISLDHTDRLGDTLSQIAFEKAGIIKKGCPVISATDEVEARNVIIGRANELEAPVYDASIIDFRIKKSDIKGYVFDVDILGKKYESLEISMLGTHQVKNAITALCTLTLLIQNERIVLSDKAIYEGLKRAKQIGRFEIMKENPYVILDGAHNPEGAKALYDVVKNQFDNKKILMVVGILEDKDIDSILDYFTSITNDFVITEPSNPRKIEASQLAKRFTQRGLKSVVWKKPKDAVEFVKACYSNYDVIIFAGSLYMIGEIRGLIKDEEGR
ncbi:MAG: bifunctional folylpolyglutamate synthase/dihydrofolate synthase [Eubacteriales bacterium]|nr:bifunctional folylpolyglutamate synthase/dihydrofolate synthase [Eubacteriales bacterium]